jgi:hypothetical protein
VAFCILMHYIHFRKFTGVLCQILSEAQAAVGSFRIVKHRIGDRSGMCNGMLAYVLPIEKWTVSIDAMSTGTTEYLKRWAQCNLLACCGTPLVCSLITCKLLTLYNRLQEWTSAGFWEDRSCVLKVRSATRLRSTDGTTNTRNSPVWSFHNPNATMQTRFQSSFRLTLGAVLL